MTKPFWVFAIVTVLCLGYGVWSGRNAERWQTERTEALAVGKVLRREADSLKRDAERLVQVKDSLLAVANRYRDTPRPPQPLPPDTTLRDSLRYAVERYTVAEQDAVYAHLEAQTLRGALDSAQASIVRLRGSVALMEARGDSLASVLARAPNPCPRILGLPVPKVGVGYALTTGGQGIGVALTIPLGGC